MKGFKPSCRIRQTANGDWIITPPPGTRLYIDGDTRIHDHLSYHQRPNLREQYLTTNRPWISRVSAVDNDWFSICWSPELGLFCAVAITGGANHVMTSPDGITWTIRVSAADNEWRSVCWSPELGMFCAVSSDGVGNRVMTSPDGITWTIRVSAADNDWHTICWSPELGLFCAVAITGTDDRVMTSPDGITWTIRVSAADNNWRSVCWSPELGLFCAVAASGVGDRVMTSPDGITWTIRVSAADNSWQSICWSPELALFCVVSITGALNRVMTSPDGINWTIRVTPVNNQWFSVCWSPELGLFCAVSNTGTDDRVMTSPDGITWTVRVSAEDNGWRSVCWSPELGLFCSVADSGTDDRVMTSPRVLGVNSLTVSGEVSWFYDDIILKGQDASLDKRGDFGEHFFFATVSEEITIGVGQGSGGICGNNDLNQADSVMLGCVTRITQAPGGGATQVSVGRATNPDEYVKLGPVALGSVTTWPANSDTTMEGPLFNDINRKMMVTTNVDVTVSAMKIRVTTFYMKSYPPTG